MKIHKSRLRIIPKKVSLPLLVFCLVLGVVVLGFAGIVSRSNATIQNKDQEIRSIKIELENIKQDNTDLKRQLDDAKKEITFNPANLLKYTNQERLKNGRVALVLNTKLNTSAKLKVTDMVEKNYWSHDSPLGEEPWAFFSRAGYRYYKAGENLAYGQKTGQEVVEGWMKSPNHRDNLLDSRFREVGFGTARKVYSYINSHEVNVVVAHYGATY